MELKRDNKGAGQGSEVKEVIVGQGRVAGDAEITEDHWKNLGFYCE